MKVTVNGVTVYARDYQETRISAELEAENQLVERMRADNKAAVEAAEAKKNNEAEAMRLYTSRNVTLGTVFTHVPAHLEQLVAELEDEAFRRECEQDAAMKAAAEAANELTASATAGSGVSEERDDTATARLASRPRRLREQSDEASEVADAMPNTAALTDGDVRVPQAKSRRTASQSEHDDDAEDEARRAAIAAVIRVGDVRDGCYSSTARSSNSANI